MNRYSGIDTRLKARQQLKQQERRVIIGPRESLCGRSTFATRARGLETCKDCGNYHDPTNAREQE